VRPAQLCRLIVIVLALANLGRLHQTAAPWREAGQLAHEIQRAVGDVRRQSSPGDLLLLDVAANYRGCPVWIWASPFALRPPFYRRDVARKLIVLETPEVYYHPERWSEQAPWPQIRAAAGAAWVVNGHAPRSVRVIAISSEKVRAAMDEADPELGDRGSFERLVQSLTR
jgi:hypothetical protein